MQMTGRAQVEGLAVPQHWGAQPARDGTWDFALWAPSAGEVSVALNGLHPLSRDDGGTFRGRLPGRHGDAYALVVDGRRIADPATRWQQRGLTGPSRLVDPGRLDGPSGPDRPLSEAVICEIHVGSFTAEGTFAAAARAPQLRRLAELGITMIELMPVGAFPGKRGWGYDSVLPWAPHPAYGTPSDLRHLVDAAHDLGLQVCLDVVFNHFGPEDCALLTICPEFFLDQSNDWGRAIDYRRPEVQAYFSGCALWWLRAYGIDALRFDALHLLADPKGKTTGPCDFTEDLARAIRTAPLGRKVHLTAEDSRNLARPYLPGSGLYDAVWADDYHHAQHVLLTGDSFGYYADFRDHPLEDMALALRAGYARPGAEPPEEDKTGEPPPALPPQNRIAFNLNHDHAGNRPRGDRLVSLIGTEKALVCHALLLTSPSVPLLFMGEEIGSRAPFPWFADYTGEIAARMRAQREALFDDPEAPQEPMIDPFDPATMQAACPYTTAGQDAPLWRDLTRRLTELRRDSLLPLFRSGCLAPPRIRIAAPSALVMRLDYRDGAITSLACFSPDDRISAPDWRDALFRLGNVDAPPCFGLWLHPAGPAPDPDLHGD